MRTEPLIFELGARGRRAFCLPEIDVEGQAEDLLPQQYRRKSEPQLPEVSEVEIVRHFTRLSSLNYGVDTGFYPLGSCTMKYNPKVNEEVARLPGFTYLHPYFPEEAVQGALELMYKLQTYLAEICGMDAFTLQPAAGAHGELTGLLLINAYHRSRGDLKRKKVIVPNSAHGTNPASATMAGLEIMEIGTNERGGVDLESLRQAAGPDTAALMLTNPNTLGLFEEDILEIEAVVHGAGGLLYYDGANLNAILGLARPGDMGFDVVHLNLHKTFSTPHGGGGPGSGPVGVKEALRPFLPVPLVAYDQERDRYFLDYNYPQSIGKVKAFYGNFNVMVKAYTYIRSLGPEGLKAVGEQAVLSANYLLNRLRGRYHLPYNRICKHEFVVAPPPEVLAVGVRTLDIAKRLLDYGFHAPTVYFPLIVPEAMMIEPTETEPKEVLDAFADALLAIAEEAVRDPEVMHAAPHRTPVRRLDEVRAARQPVLCWQGEEGKPG